MRGLALILIAAAALAAGCGSDGPEASDTTPRPPSTHPEVATGLEVPWGIAFLPDGDALVSERISGQIVRIPAAGGDPEVEMIVPDVDRHAGEGGLLGIAVSPDYAEDGLVYAYLTTEEDNRIVRFRLGEEPEPVLTGLARAQNHNGGRIAFGPDGKLYAGVGRRPRHVAPAGPRVAQRQDPAHGARRRRARRQPDGRLAGVVVRAPQRAGPGLGRRGPALGDRVRGGRDRRGEPDPSRRELRLARGRGRRRRGEGFTDPLVTWPTSEASPSGAAIVGDDLYVAALRGERLWRVPLDGERAGTPVAELDGELGRLRTVAVAPDGALWVATSNRDGRGSPEPGDDRIVRVSPPGA